jgi:hypothetical protein
MKIEDLMTKLNDFVREHTLLEVLQVLLFEVLHILFFEVLHVLVLQKSKYFKYIREVLTVKSTST